MTGESGCVGKTAHTSYQKASKVAKHINRMDESARMNVYRCPVCSYFHVGNSQETAKKKPYNRKEQYDEGI